MLVGCSSKEAPEELEFETAAMAMVKEAESAIVLFDMAPSVAEAKAKYDVVKDLFTRIPGAPDCYSQGVELSIALGRVSEFVYGMAESTRLAESSVQLASNEDAKKSRDMVDRSAKELKLFLIDVESAIENPTEPLSKRIMDQLAE
jgi:hypothetical protein